MSQYRLSQQSDASREIARAFAGSPDFSLLLEVREDKCFPGAPGWLGLGSLSLKPRESQEPHENGLAALVDAVAHGFYEWKVSSRERLQTSLFEICNAANPALGAEQRDNQKRKVVKAMDGLVHVVQRVGLQHPVFDAGSLCSMPFKRPTTVVTDTNSVLQGSLDFVVRFLCPMARIKVPAIVQMEILCWVDNYFGARRDSSKIPRFFGSVLNDHMRGQGAQRALLRLELLSDVELERARIGADPLRGIVQPDQEDKNLGSTTVQRSFADRLILETALQHLHQVNPGHPVILLTSDQGVARMALAEGTQVLFYEAADLEWLVGSTLLGTSFNPFTGALYSVPLTDLLWELAVTFGSCRIRASTSDQSVEVSALGEQFTWMPYHAKEDLLWVVANSKGMPGGSNTDPRAETEDGDAEPEADRAPETPASKPALPRILQPSYKFSPHSMFRLVQLLLPPSPHLNAELMISLGFTHERKLAEYRGFLYSGRFIEYSKTDITKTERLDSLWNALRGNNYEQLGQVLLGVESLAVFFEFIRAHQPVGSGAEWPIKEGALPNYRCLLEMSGLVLQIVGEGIYATPNNPLPSAFAEIAYSAYLKLARREDQYIATGAWLEELARGHGVHPLMARNRLQESRAAGMIERYIEGSTPDTRYSGRTFCMVEYNNGQLNTQDVALYEGDFLLPGKGGVSLRLKRGKQ